MVVVEPFTFEVSEFEVSEFEILEFEFVGFEVVFDFSPETQATTKPGGKETARSKLTFSSDPRSLKTSSWPVCLVFFFL